MPKRPELKQFSDLTLGDFERHPVWVNCHVVDYDEPWYDDTDEETVRPWAGPVPVPPGSSLLVRADFVAADGSRFTGFLTPSDSTWPYATNHPHLFAGPFTIGFWEGVVPGVAKFRARLYDVTGKSAEELFPFRATTSPGLLEPAVEDLVEGFYSIERFGAEPRIGY
jgi:hypothetical protein